MSKQSDSEWRRLTLALSQGQPERVRVALHRALRSEQNYSLITDEIAVLLESLGLANDVLGVLERKCRLAPEERRPVLQLARALKRRGNTTRLRQTLTWAHDLRADGDALRLELADLLEATRQYEMAIDELYLTNEYARAELNTLRRLARLHGLAGHRAECVRAWRRAVSVAGVAVADEDLTALGIALSNADQHDDAIEVLTRAVQVRNNAETYANLGMALIQGDRVSDAIRCFERALRSDETSLQANFGLGLALRVSGRTLEAIERLQRVTELAPSWEVAYLEFGIALKVGGQLRLAKSALLRAAILAPEDRGIQAELQTVLQHDLTSVFSDSAGEGSSITGTLTSFPLEDVLEFLRFQRLTGTLVLTSRSQGEGEVRLHQGRLVSARSPHGRRDVPVSAQSEVEKLFAQARSALEELQGWRRGQFSFHRIDSEREREPAVTIDLAELLLEIARNQDEEREV